MKHRLFVASERLRPGPLRLERDQFRYLVRVLRLRPGDSLMLFDGEGKETVATVAEVDRALAKVVLHVAEPPAAKTTASPRSLLWLICSVLKGERMSLVVQKATELGVGRITPVFTERSIPQTDPGKASERVERWRRISREASRQCGRADTPRIDEIAPLREAARAVPADAWKVILFEGATESLLRNALPIALPPPAIAVVAIGPEGGFGPDDLAVARDTGFTVAGLGATILRAETAALATLAILGFSFGDLG
ncbi:MAG: 16S rRNA (uracil(1498)-N(3))-methyltransferase [Pseudomonadota bacterium]